MWVPIKATRGRGASMTLGGEFRGEVWGTSGKLTERALRGLYWSFDGETCLHGAAKELFRYELLTILVLFPRRAGTNDACKALTPTSFSAPFRELLSRFQENFAFPNEFSVWKGDFFVRVRSLTPIWQTRIVGCLQVSDEDALIIGRKKGEE